MFKADTTTVAFLGGRAKGERGQVFRPWLKDDRSPEGSARYVERSDEDVGSSIGLRFSS